MTDRESADAYLDSCWDDDLTSEQATYRLVALLAEVRAEARREALEEDVVSGAQQARARISELEARNAEVEAEAAVMREALERALDIMAEQPGDTWAPDPVADALDDARSALAPNAGRALLDEVAAKDARISTLEAENRSLMEQRDAALRFAADDNKRADDYMAKWRRAHDYGEERNDECNKIQRVLNLCATERDSAIGERDALRPIVEEAVRQFPVTEIFEEYLDGPCLSERSAGEWVCSSCGGRGSNEGNVDHHDCLRDDAERVLAKLDAGSTPKGQDP